MLMIGAGLCFTFLDTSAKYLVLSGLPSEFVSWMRFAVHLAIVPILFRAWSNRRVLRYQNLWLQMLRGVFLFGSTIFNFLALGHLQLAETMSIAFFGPMLITALAGPLLGEWAGWRRWLAVGAGFVGMLFITRPGFGVIGIGHLFAFCSVSSYAFYAIMTRSLSGTETAESLVFYSALTPVVLMLPVIPASAELPATPLLVVLLLSLGIYGAIGHYMLVRAFRSATATALAPFPYLQIIWMVAAGYLVFGDLPDRYTAIGAGIIVASGLYIAHRERQLRIASRVPVGR